MTAKRVGIEHLRRAEKECSGAGNRALFAWSPRRQTVAGEQANHAGGRHKASVYVGIGSARILPGSKIPRRLTHPTLGA